MRNLQSLPIEEVSSRAKTLYFERYPHLKQIWADEFGRFDVNGQSNLIEQNRINNGKVWLIQREQVEGSKGVEALDDAETIEKKIKSAKKDK